MKIDIRRKMLLSCVSNFIKNVGCNLKFFICLDDFFFEILWLCGSLFLDEYCEIL